MASRYRAAMEQVMASKPRTASGYDRSHVDHVRATCLYVATKLGDLLDELVVVGGLVPSLLVDQADAHEQHVGTLDLDVGLALGLLDNKRYQTLTERLRAARFSPDTNDQGNPSRQRWKIEGPPTVTIDFLIPPTRPDERGGDIKHIEADFAAFVAPGLRLAFLDRVRVPLAGKTIFGEQATRQVWVCGPAAFVAMKALAFRGRGENKDAYDLVYLLRNHQAGVTGIATRLAPLLPEAEAAEAVRILDEDFSSSDGVGPRRVAEFLFNARDDDAEADAWGAIRDLLDRLPK